MTTVPARNLLQIAGYGVYQALGGGMDPTFKTSNNDPVIEFGLTSNLTRGGSMAGEESVTTCSFHEAGSSKQVLQEGEDHDQAEVLDGPRDERWLQLGIGAQANEPYEIDNHRSRMIELDFFSSNHHREAAAATPPHGGEIGNGASAITGPPLFFQQPMSTSLSLGQYQPDISWGTWPDCSSWDNNQNPILTSPSVVPFRSQSYLRHPFLQTSFVPESYGGLGSGSDVRVVDAPGGRQSGVWFVLQPSDIQRRGPTLPQLRKNYLRIKDGRVTIRLLMKYVAKKLELIKDTEIEISCRGQRLLPSMTLQLVRDSIWCSRDAIAPPAESTTAAHVMILQYGTSA